MTPSRFAITENITGHLTSSSLHKLCDT